MNKQFILEAIAQANNSTDPNTKVGCVIVKDGKIISVGYNTLPEGLQVCEYPLDCRQGDFLDTKYPYVLHSEAKAIIDAKCCLNGAQIYVTLFPCNECSKLIIQSGIKTIYYLDDKYKDTDAVKASKRMLKDAKIEFIQIEE